MVYAIYNIILLLLIAFLFYLGYKTATFKPSSVTASVLIYVVAAIFANVGYFLELHSASVEVYKILIKLQYVPWVFQNLAVIWMVERLVGTKMSDCYKALQSANAILMLIAVFSIGYNTMYAANIATVYNGHFMQCMVTPGWYYYIYYFNVSITELLAVLLCYNRYKNSIGAAKKRAFWVAAGISTSLICKIIKASGLLGWFDLFIFGYFAAVLGFYIALVRYGYFDSVQTGIENALKYVGEGFMVLSTDGTILYANPQISKISPFLKVDVNISQTAQFNEVLQVSDEEIDIRGKKYEVRFDEINEYDTVIGYTVWLINVTEHYNNIEQLKLLTQKAQEASEAKTAFLTNMSHEIRTPLNSILGMNELVMRESKNRHILQYSSNIYAAGKSLLAIMNSILDISQIEVGKLVITEGEYRLSSVIAEIWNITHDKARENGLDFIWEVAENIPDELIGDKIRLQQAVYNIVDNAIKFTMHGQVKVSIGCKPIAKNSVKLQIIVEDTGIGIKEADIRKLFKRFERIETNSEKYISGTGIGLNIAKLLIDMMGGRISVKSQYGVGSEFAIEIPQRVAGQRAIGSFDCIIKSAKEISKEKEKHIITKDTDVLVVDDNIINLKVIEGLLKPTRIHVHTADNGYDAIELASRNKYDIIFLDQMMPGISGTGTLKIMREQNILGQTPVIALTADAGVGMKEKFISRGFTDYISKPVHWELLENIIEKYLPTNKITDDIAVSECTVIAICDDAQRLNVLREEFTDEYKVVCLKNAAQAKKFIDKIN